MHPKQTLYIFDSAYNFGEFEMEKKGKQIIIFLASVVLILAAATFIIVKGSNFYVEDSIPSNETERGEKINVGDSMPPNETEPVEKIKIDTLEVTYWNPWGGMMRKSDAPSGLMADMCIEYAQLTLPDYVDSDIIVSATVTKSIEWTDDTEEGKKKIEELGSPWINPHGKECYLNVNDVLKGNFEMNQIYLKTDVDDPNFSVGEEYILFIKAPETENQNYQIQEPLGYLVKKGSNYTERMQNVSISRDELNYLTSLSDKELDWYRSMAASPQVFIGEMITSTDDNKLEQSQSNDYLSLESSQPHRVRVISSIKGNLSGTVNFTYEGSYITNEMMNDYLVQEQWTLENVKNLYRLESNSFGHYRSDSWDPEVSPLKSGDIYLICFSEYEGDYHMWASKTDYRIDEHNEKEIQRLAENYKKTLNKIENYFVYEF